MHRFDLLRFASPAFDVHVECSSGTYVRSLVAEVGTRLGTGAHLTALRRTAIGSFDVALATPPDDPGRPLPADAAVAHLPRVVLDGEEARVAAFGRVLGPAGIEGPYRVVEPGGGLIGVYRDDGPKAVPEVILAPA